MSQDAEYRTTEEKVQNIEHYLVRKVDTIQRLVVMAVAVSTVGALLAIWGVVGQKRVITIAERAGTEAPHDALAQEPGHTGGDRPADAAPEPPQAAHRTPPPKAAEPGATVADEKKAPVPPTRAAPSAETPPASAEDANASPGEGSESGRFVVEASAIAEDIVGLSPQGTAGRFPESQSRVFCWSRIVTPDFEAIPAAERAVTHRWIHEETVVHERRITIGSNSYRVYSMAIIDGKPGSWRVEILDASGRVIGIERFVVG